MTRDPNEYRDESRTELVRIDRVHRGIKVFSGMLGFCRCFFISRLGHDLSDCPAGSAKLDGDHSWIADQFAPELLQVRRRLLDIVDLNSKMMDAGSKP